MKTNVSIVSILLLALTVVTATQARADVAWSSVASGCALQTDANTPNLASTSADFGTVTFASDQSGTIKLTCPVQASFNRQGNVFVLTFANNNGFDGSVDHCYIKADFWRRALTPSSPFELLEDIGTITTQGRVFDGPTTLTGGLLSSLNFNSSYHWVDIELFRDSPTAICNPAVIGTFLDTIIP